MISHHSNWKDMAGKIHPAIKVPLSLCDVSQLVSWCARGPVVFSSPNFWWAREFGTFCFMAKRSQEETGYTAVFFATREGHLDILNLLLQAKARISSLWKLVFNGFISRTWPVFICFHDIYWYLIKRLFHDDFMDNVTSDILLLFMMISRVLASWSSCPWIGPGLSAHRLQPRRRHALAAGGDGGPVAGGEKSVGGQGQSGAESSGVLSWDQLRNPTFWKKAWQIFFWFAKKKWFGLIGFPFGVAAKELAKTPEIRSLGTAKPCGPATGKL